jgi:hypothetical protein
MPKGVVRDTGGHAVALHYTTKAVYNVGPGEVRELPRAPSSDLRIR